MTKQEVQAEKAPFDDCRAALVFALNAHRVVAPTAFMNKAMAAVRVEMKKSKKKRKVETLYAVFGNPELANPEELLEMERQRVKHKRGGSLVRVEALRFRDGMEKHHLAGLILHHFARLDHQHQAVLSGLLIEAYSPCSCNSLCCSGWRMNECWGKALFDMCTILQHKAEIPSEPGKKGLSSQPFLRRMVVESFFTKNEINLADISRRARVGYVTAAKHREWITAYLERCESEAWGQIAPILDAAGITGHHL